MNMKTLRYLTLLTLSLIMATSCMNDHDEPEFKQPPYGNNNIGEANTTIAELKASYSKTILNNGYELFTEDKVIEGVVVANDETGNVYKQFVINDETGAIIVGVDDVGLYAVLPIGTRVRISCKGLYIGGYGSLAQIGTKYFNTKYDEFQIGRIAKPDFQKHIRIVGKAANSEPEMTPMEVTEQYLADSKNKNSAPIYVVLKNVSIAEADGTRKFAPEEEQISETNTAVERHVNIGSQQVIFRLSTYADFANEIIPKGKFNITGVLTRYRNPGNSSKDYWQFLLSSTDDVKPVTE